MPSTAISMLDYDPESKVMTIAYISGQTYLYKGIPEMVYKELKASRIKGRYFRFFIKDKYPFEKLANV